MEKVKYYYSKPVYAQNVQMFTDSEGNILWINEKSTSSPKRVTRVTIASIYDPDTNTLRFGSAVCSPKDIFVKSIGRQLAYTRATQRPEITVRVTNRKKIREVSERYANDIIEKHV